MRRLLEPVRGPQVQPGAAPAGALPVEWSVFAAPVAELAGFTEEQAREAAEHKADRTDPDRIQMPKRFAIYLVNPEQTRYILTSVTPREGGHARSPKEHAMHPELLSAAGRRAPP